MKLYLLECLMLALPTLYTNRNEVLLEPAQGNTAECSKYSTG